MLGDVTPRELREIVGARIGSAPLPGDYEGQVRRKAMEAMAAQGLRERIEAGLADDKPVEALRYTLFRHFRHTGNRSLCDGFLMTRSRQVDLAAMAVYLGMDEKAPYLQDLLWAECDSAWWTMPSHEYFEAPIDLRVAMCGFHYARIARLLSNKIGGEVADRIYAEVRRRVLAEYVAPGRDYWWSRSSNNWNAVCSGAIGLAAMLIEDDPDRLAEILRRVLASLPIFLSGFTDDGGCTEGAGYWRYGFQWYVLFAAGLHAFTDGRVNIMAGEKVERICRYPLTVWVAPGQDLPFADAHGAFMPSFLAVLINRFHDAGELFGLCKLTEEGQLQIDSLTDLLCFDDRPLEPSHDAADYYLPELAVAKVRAGAVTVGCKAGHNHEHHNHNDVGNFLVHRGRTFFVTDLGAPVYSARTFGRHRYESIFCNSLGHNVPVINGQGQPTGAGARGSMRCEGLNGGGARMVTIEMAGAYAEPALSALTRRIEMPDGQEQVVLTDRFEFDQPPNDVREHFMTFLPAKVRDGGRAVEIVSQSDGAAVLSAKSPGRFEVEELAAESAESRAGQLVRRIVFVPEKLDKTMSLGFTVAFE